MASFKAAVRFLDGSTGVFYVDDVPDHQTAQLALEAEYDLRACLVAEVPPLALEMAPPEAA